MTQIVALSAEPRTGTGKGSARQARREGLIPAVIYGGKQEPVTISLNFRAFNKILHQPGFFTHLFDVSLGGETHRVLPRDVQMDPVSDNPLHVDFLRVTDETRITVMIPVEFVGQEKSAGLKRGAVLNIVRHEVEVECSAANIPEHITVDVSSFNVGDSIHISAVALPEGVTPTIERDFTIATIAAPSGMKADAEDAG